MDIAVSVGGYDLKVKVVRLSISSDRKCALKEGQHLNSEPRMAMVVQMIWGWEIETKLYFFVWT